MRRHDASRRGRVWMCIHMAGSYLYTIGGAPLSSLRREIAGKRFAAWAHRAIDSRPEHFVGCARRTPQGADFTRRGRYCDVLLPKIAHCRCHVLFHADDLSALAFADGGACQNRIARGDRRGSHIAAFRDRRMGSSAGPFARHLDVANARPGLRQTLGPHQINRQQPVQGSDTGAIFKEPVTRTSP